MTRLRVAVESTSGTAIQGTARAVGDGRLRGAGIRKLVELTGVAQRPVRRGDEPAGDLDHPRDRVGQPGRCAHLHLGARFPGPRRALDGRQGTGGEHQDHGLLGVEDAPGVLGQHPQDLGLGERGVDGEGGLHEAAQLGGVTGGGLLGLTALTPQQDALDGNGDTLGKAGCRFEVGATVSTPAEPGDEAQGAERKSAQVHGHHQHRLDLRVGLGLAVTAGRSGLSAVGWALAPGADDDLGPAVGEHPPHQGLAVGVRVAHQVRVPRPLPTVGDAPQLALLVGDVDGEEVGEGGHDHLDEPHHRLVVGLERGGEHVTGSSQDGHVLAGVLGTQPAPTLGLVEPGPLDGRRRTVGHELEKLEIAILEAVPDARADLHDPDDMTADQQRGRHERGHPLAQERCGLRRLGDVVDDHRLGARRHLAHDPLAHPDFEPLGHAARPVRRTPSP